MKKTSWLGGFFVLLIVGVFPSSVVFSYTVPQASVHKNGTNQTLTANVDTLVTWSTASFDTTSAFNLTNERYTPLVAGKYLVAASVYASTATYCEAQIRINGTGQKINAISNASSGECIAAPSAILNMNGTTDYIELWANVNAGNINGDPVATFLTISLLPPEVVASASATSTTSSTSTQQQDNAGQNLFNMFILFMVSMAFMLWLMRK